MKRTAMKRSKPMKRGGRIRPNAKRKAKAFQIGFHSGAFVRFTQMQPSVFSGEVPCVCMHGSKSRGAGGTYRHIVPATDAEHMRAHSIGIESFLAEQGKSMLWLRKQEAEHWRRFEAAYQQLAA